MKKKQIIQVIGILSVILCGIIFSLFAFTMKSQAAGLFDEHLSVNNLYSLYPLKNYQLDYYADSGGWISKGVSYGIYAIANFLWLMSCFISNFAGFLVQECYELDFINSIAEDIGTSIQVIAGINGEGASDGLFQRALPWVILMMGFFVVYHGLLKRETSKALSGVGHMILIFMLAFGFIKFAPTFITNLNELSSDISTEVLDVGTKLIISDSEVKGKDSVDMIRNSMFAMQIEKPWLLMQYGSTDKDEIGAEKVAKLLNLSPGSEERDEIVKNEVEENGNDNMGTGENIYRLALAAFFLIFNIFISFFILILAGTMVLTQFMFIIYAMLLPISFLLSMFPNQENKCKQAVEKVFNVIFARAGVTLIVTIIFSLSSICYHFTVDKAFAMTIFLQVILFWGVFKKTDEIMSMFSLNTSSSQNVMNQAGYRAKSKMRKGWYTLSHLAQGAGMAKMASTMKEQQKTNPLPKHKKMAGDENSHSIILADGAMSPDKDKKKKFTQTAGAFTGELADMKDKAVHGAKMLGKGIQDMPTNVKYGGHKAVGAMKQAPKDFMDGYMKEKALQNQKRRESLDYYNMKMDKRRSAVNQKMPDRAMGHNTVSPHSAYNRNHGVNERSTQKVNADKPIQTSMVKQPERGRKNIDRGNSINNQRRVKPVKNAPKAVNVQVAKESKRGDK